MRDSRRTDEVLRALGVSHDTKSERQRSFLGKLVLVRVLILSLFLGVAAWQVLSVTRNVSSLSPVFWLIGATYAVSLINAVWLRFTRQLTRFCYGQLIVDVVLITVASYISGGALSSFNFLFLLVIMGASLVLSFRGAVIIATLSGISYALLASQALPSLDGNNVPASFQHILGVYVTLMVIALVSGYLARELETVGGIAQAHAKNLSELSYHQKQLFDDISEGIITLDLDTTITNVNKAARMILGISEAEASSLVGEDLPRVFNKYDVSGAEKLLEHGLSATQPAELSINGGEAADDISITCSVRPMVDSAGEATGRIVLFNDVSHVKSIEKRLSVHEKVTKLLAESRRSDTDVVLAQGKVEMIGESFVMKQVFNLVDKIAKSEASVLISGESGTGKELIARSVHANGPRANKSFVAINCGAIPENLIESELFGHKKGSFTGATHDNPGLFREADAGTIFLDEIGELPLQLQTKLLRVLQDKKVRAVGDVRDVLVDVRVIAASNRELKDEIAAGRFREDLFYRLNVVNVVVPPLRKRMTDIPLLVSHFIRSLSKPNEAVPQISPEALELLMNYPFPGNIRELENIIERALVLGGNAILLEHLPEEVRLHSARKEAASSSEISSGVQPGGPTFPIDLEDELAQFEIAYLQNALEQTGGVKKQAAELLGLNFRSFRYRLKKYGLEDRS